MKKNPISLFTLVLPCLAWLSALVSPVWAADGHDHGEAPVAAGVASSRFAASSESFELVGIVDGQRITLYLDRFADGSPVKDAKLELELGGVKVPVQPHGDGEFEVVLGTALKPGVTPVTAMIVVGNESDLLAGELDLHGDEAPSGRKGQVHGWKEYALWLISGGAVLLALAALFNRWRKSRHLRLGGAA